MNVESLTGLVASASGVFMALSPLLQARRIRAVGDSSEVSSGVFLMMRVNATIWLTYGLATANFVVVVPNAVALATTTFTLLAIRRHRHGAAVAPRPGIELDPGHMGRVRGGAASLARAGRRIALARR
jgi:uncharacterized protein with PQ loop repeat